MTTIEDSIIVQMKKQIDNFLPYMKSAKQKSGKTNQEIADATGVPVSNIGKFFTGNLSNPNVFNAAAVCIYLGISLDEVLGITSVKASLEELKALKAENAELKKELAFCNKMIEVHEESIRSARSAFEKEHRIIEEMLNQKR